MLRNTFLSFLVFFCCFFTFYILHKTYFPSSFLVFRVAVFISTFYLLNKFIAMLFIYLIFLTILLIVLISCSSLVKPWSVLKALQGLETARKIRKSSLFSATLLKLVCEKLILWLFSLDIPHKMVVHWCENKSANRKMLKFDHSRRHNV